jgi:DNA processing protein
VETSDLLVLALVPGLTPRAARTLLAHALLADALARPRDFVDLLGDEGVASLESGAVRRAAEAERRACDRSGVEIVGCDEPRYPQWLRRTHTPPLVLWVRGTLVPDEGCVSVGIVGARASTPLGRTFARRLGEDLVAAGLVVVSGLARGIDSAAHRGALDGGGRTVAILGSGLDRVYPPENDALAAEVARTGALVSEFPLGTGPWKQNFPRRNCTIAGWGRGVVVVEAGKRSGALSTSRAAYDEGREVMAVPGHPCAPQCEGSNALLRDGAAVVRGADDVLDELRIEKPRETASALHDEVLRAVPRGQPRSVDEIHKTTGLAMPTLLARLAALELDGALERLPGALYVRGRGYTGR